MNHLLHVGLSNCLMALALAVVAAAVGRCCRRPAVAHGLWLLVLLKLVTPPLVPIPVGWPQVGSPRSDLLAPEPAPPRAEPQDVAVPPPRPLLPEARVRAEAPADAIAPVDRQAPAPARPAPVLLDEPAPAAAPPGAPAAEEGGLSWWAALAAVWLGGSACWFLLAGGRIRRFHGLLRHAAAAPAALQAEAEVLAARLGVGRCPRVLLVPGAVSPMLWALGRSPLLLVPAGLLRRLTDEQRATLLAHELAHLGRRDHWVRVLELVVLGLYWWFPLVWWARRELREAEEECCDAWVVWAFPDSPRAYATALVETLDFLSGATPVLPPAASGIGPLPLLRRRLTMIMRGTTPRTLTGAGFLGLLGLGGLLLPLMPSWAQQPPADPARRGDFGERAQQGQAQLQIDKARAEVKRAADELDRLRHEIEKQKAEIEKRANQLQKALEDLGREEERAKANPFKGGPGGRAGMPGGMGGGGPGATLDRRLTEVERKLDQVLRELQAVRAALAKSRPNVPFPGGPGGGRPAAGPGAGPGNPSGLPGGPGVGPQAPGVPNPGGFPGRPGAGINPGPYLGGGPASAGR